LTNFLNSLPNISIHPLLIIFVAISLVTGTFTQMMIIWLIVFIHESGHYFMAAYFKWRVRGITLWIFGGVMKTDEHGNRPIREEALVTVSGPLQHVIIYIALHISASFQLLPETIIEQAFYYNTVILVFNLLPIWPLDGGKLLHLLFSVYLPYKRAYNVTIIFSICFTVMFMILQLFLPFTLTSLLIVLFILMENWSDWKQRYYVFIRFLLNRYEGRTHVKQVFPIMVAHDWLLIDVLALFKREKKHPIYVTFPDSGRIPIDESECLRGFFYEKQSHCTIGEFVEYK